jgi:uncharacterized protein with PhoU and TrkA domain
MVFNPVASYSIERGDILIALGEDENVMRFTNVCAG